MEGRSNDSNVESRRDQPLTVIGVPTLCGQTSSPASNIDFRNFTYPFPAEKLLGVPSEMKWMSLNEKSTVALENGRYDFDRSYPTRGPSLILNRVLYGYLTSANQLDAVVVVGYHTEGTAWWDYVYAFSLASAPPKLVGWFHAGSRACSGLIGVEVSNRRLTVELADPTRRHGDCCSDGFIRINYDFENGCFVQNGPKETGPVGETR